MKQRIYSKANTNTGNKLFLSTKPNFEYAKNVCRTSNLRRKICQCMQQSFKICSSCVNSCGCLKHSILKQHKMRYTNVSRKRLDCKVGTPSPLLNEKEKANMIYEKVSLYYTPESSTEFDYDSDNTLLITSFDSDSSEDDENMDGEYVF